MNNTEKCKADNCPHNPTFNPRLDEARDPIITNLIRVGMRINAHLQPDKQNNGLMFRIPKTVPNYGVPPVYKQGENGNPSYWEYVTTVIPGEVCIIENTSDACVGAAEVEIIAANDTGIIGKATMVQYALPSNEKLAQYLFHMSGLREGTVIIHTNGKHGSYVEVRDKYQSHPVYLACNPNGEVYEVEDSFDNDGATASEPMETHPYIFQHLFGITEEELLKDVVRFGYQVSRVRLNKTSFGPLMDKARAYQIIHVREVAKVVYVDIRTDDILSLAEDFSLDEVQTILSEASDINKKAKAAIAQKIQDDKLRPKLIDGQTWLN